MTRSIVYAHTIYKLELSGALALLVRIAELFRSSFWGRACLWSWRGGYSYCGPHNGTYLRSSFFALWLGSIRSAAAAFRAASRPLRQSCNATHSNEPHHAADKKPQGSWSICCHFFSLQGESIA